MTPPFGWIELHERFTGTSIFLRKDAIIAVGTGTTLWVSPGGRPIEVKESVEEILKIMHPEK